MLFRGLAILGYYGLGRLSLEIFMFQRKNGLNPMQSLFVCTYDYLDSPGFVGRGFAALIYHSPRDII